jgi:ApbE superfamily uncharacterized protein (UPF0280 family)
MTRLPQIAWLADGKRLHLQDGPIDLIVEAKAARPMCARPMRRRRGASRVCSMNSARTAELRAPADPAQCALQGRVARRMHAAVAPFAADHFITPMAAVAGAWPKRFWRDAAARRADRAYVNNGGDIALHLAGASSFRSA